MSAGVWNPSTDLPNNSNQLIAEWATVIDREKLTAKVSQFDEQTVLKIMPLMKQEALFWQESVGTFSDEAIRQLIYFFTLAEELHSSLYAGNKSPVIALNKMLKLRKAPLSKDDLLWIKANSSNRFIPNGSLNL